MAVRYRRRAEVLYRDLGDVVLVLVPGTAGATRLEGGAVTVWDAAEQGVDPRALAADAGVPEGVVRPVVDGLVARGVLVPE